MRYIAIYRRKVAESEAIYLLERTGLNPVDIASLAALPGDVGSAKGVDSIGQSICKFLRQGDSHRPGLLQLSARLHRSQSTRRVVTEFYALVYHS